MNNLKRLLVLGLVGAFGATHAAPVVVTPGSVAKYVYLPKAALASGSGGGGSSVEGATLAANRGIFQTCLRSSQTVPAPEGFTKGTLQLIMVAGGGGGGGGGGSPNRQTRTTAGAGGTGGDGGNTTVLVGGATHMARGGKGGGGGAGGRPTSSSPWPSAGNGGDSYGSPGRGGTLVVFDRDPAQAAPVVPYGPSTPDEVWYPSWSLTQPGYLQYGSTNYTLGTFTPTRNVAYFYLGSQYTTIKNPTSTVTAHAYAGMAGSGSAKYAYATDFKPVFAPGTPAYAPIGMSCGAPAPGWGGDGGHAAHNYWGFVSAGGGAGGSGEVMAMEVKYEGGPIVVTIGAAGTAGAAGAWGTGPIYHTDGYGAGGYPGFAGGVGTNGAVVMRFIPQ